MFRTRCTCTFSMRSRQRQRAKRLIQRSMQCICPARRTRHHYHRFQFPNRGRSSRVVHRLTMRQVRYRLSRQLPQVRLLKQCLPPLMCTDYRILHCRQQRCIVPDISIHNDWATDESLGGGLTASTFALAHLGGVIALLNEGLVSAGKSPVGFLNPWVYANPDTFRDFVSVRG